MFVSHVDFVVGGKAEALSNLRQHNLNDTAYLGFQEQLFAELGIKAVEPEGKNLGKHDGRVEVASLGQFSPPAGAALLTANEARSI